MWGLMDGYCRSSFYFILMLKSLIGIFTIITNGIIMAVLHKKNDNTTQGNVRYFKDWSRSRKVPNLTFNDQYRRWNDQKSFHWLWRIFWLVPLSYRLSLLFIFQGFIRIHLHILMKKGLFFITDFGTYHWSPIKIFVSKTWLDSKILINICGFFSTTVIFASLFSLFFASVDRFSFRVTNHRIRHLFQLGVRISLS